VSGDTLPSSTKTFQSSTQREFVVMATRTPQREEPPAAAADSPDKEWVTEHARQVRGGGAPSRRTLCVLKRLFEVAGDSGSVRMFSQNQTIRGRVDLASVGRCPGCCPAACLCWESLSSPTSTPRTRSPHSDRWDSHTHTHTAHDVHTH